MKRLLPLAAVGVLATLAHATVAPVSSAPIPEALQIELLEHQWTQAATAADHPVLNDLLDDKFIEIFPGNVRRNKHDLLAAPALPPGGSQLLDGMRVQILDDVAVVTGVNRYTPARGYKTIEYLFTDVLVKRDDGWHVVAARMRRKDTGSV
ncbi:nuclear transport factor 2 family protein [Paraburkholderia sp. J7]|uniref:nuclear transport factor 2 family protein n=1 Tax=Paraburkholderia sp. J7 TaxID=2805438 RepID=UPI002AB7AB6F|nr:nuclear transport factor 2 family protein [Paraburkholderia sp. J7]